METTEIVRGNDGAKNSATRGTLSEMRSRHPSRMEPIHWIPPDSSALLDVGCNVGELLKDCRIRYPKMHLAGIDINRSSIEKARTKLPGADIQQGHGFQLPFPDNQFECVTCIEVIEHVPQEYRPLLMSEMRRVLAPGGRLVLRCPHAGLFSWLDAQNFRFRFPRLYKKLVRDGNRDKYYKDAEEELVWHHHFKHQELIELAGSGWEIEACQFGGLILFPITDILRWPFYRLKRTNNFVVRGLEKIAGWELAIDFGKSSFGILLVLRKQ